MARSNATENVLVFADEGTPRELTDLETVETTNGIRYQLRGTNSKRVPVYQTAAGEISLVDEENLEEILKIRDRDTNEIVFTREPTPEFFKNRPKYVNCPWCNKPEPVLFRSNDAALKELGFEPPDKKHIERSTVLVHARAAHPEKLADLIARGQVSQAEADSLKHL